MSYAVWCAYNGSPLDVYPPFPYTSQSPTLYKEVTWKSKDDLWDEIDRICAEQSNKYSTGQNLFHLIPLFTNPSMIIEQWHLDMINEYNYVTEFHIPIAKSLDEADAFRLDCFSIIKSEINNCLKFEK